MSSLSIQPIFNYLKENYEDKFTLEHFELNEGWVKQTKFYDYPERYGLDEETYLNNIKKSIFSPERFCENLDICFDSNLKLFAKTIGYQEIDKDLLLKQIKDLPAYLIPLAEYILIKSNTSFSPTLNVDAFRGDRDSKVISFIIDAIPTYALLNYLYNDEIKNKYFCLGTGKSLNQIIPYYIIDDINKNNEKYEIFIFENCEGGFGCPDAKYIYDYLLKNIAVDKISNIKFYHILTHVEILSIWHILKNIYISSSQIIICDTIGTGHDLINEINKYNEKLKIINKITNNSFSCNFLNTNKIITYLCTGKKIIFYLPSINKFVGHITKQLFILDILSSEIIKNNNIEKDLNLDGDSYYNKYLKYKNKYIKLKTTLTK